jgi:peptide/nickel transport system permease protein
MVQESTHNEQPVMAEAMGPWKLAWRQLCRHRLAVWAGRILVAMYAIMLLDGFLCPMDYDSQRRDHAYHPPSRLHFFDDQGRFHLRPFVYGSGYTFDPVTFERRWAEDPNQVYPLRFFTEGDSTTMLLGTIPVHRHLFGVDAPGRLYLLGADYQGRDIFSRLIFAARVSLTIGLVGTTISMAIGMIVGGLSGSVGGWGDNLIQRLCELIMLIPGLYTLMILYNALPAGLSSVQVYFGVVVILAFIGWASLARIIRGMVLSIKTSDFVTAARAAGVGPWRILVRHVLPGTFSYAVVAASLSIPAYILGESGLSLIGMGIQDPVPSWGNMLHAAVNIAELTKHPWLLWPGVAIFVTVMAFNFLGDGLRDALDPRMRTS